MQMGRPRYDMKILHFYFWVLIVPTHKNPVDQIFDQNMTTAHIVWELKKTSTPKVTHILGNTLCYSSKTRCDIYYRYNCK